MVALVPSASQVIASAPIPSATIAAVNNRDLRKMAFTLNVDPEIRIRDLKLLVARELHIDFGFVLLAGRSQVDDDDV
jgi:hypothetical protein